MAIGESAIREMTKTVGERESRPYYGYTNYTHYSDYISRRREMSNTVEPIFFYLKRENGESAADVWKRIPEVERNCDMKTITAAELLASKLLSITNVSQTTNHGHKTRVNKLLLVALTTQHLHANQKLLTASTLQWMPDSLAT